MAENKPGVILYFETLQAIEALDAEDAKQIIAAVLHYSRDGETPTLQGTLAALWFLIQSSLDRDGDRYNTRRLRGVWLTYCRKCKECGAEPLAFDEWERQRAVNDTFTSVEQSVDISSPTPTTATAATLSPSSTEAPTKRKRSAAPSPTGALKHKYGEHGWVQLTDEEYERLQRELGDAELQRCIDYIDESAQVNGNKNKWKDWNLVIRRCHRDGWGLSRQATARSGSQGAMEDIQELHRQFEEEEY